MYGQIRLHFANFSRPLVEAFSKYLERILYLYQHYTWESIKDFHIAFHRARIAEGIDDPVGWSRVDQDIENSNLVRREKLTRPTYDKGTSSQVENKGGKVYHCRRYNSGMDCYADCKYQHTCSTCGGNHPAKATHGHTNFPTNSRAPTAGPNPEYSSNPNLINLPPRSKREPRD